MKFKSEIKTVTTTKRRLYELASGVDLSVTIVNDSVNGVQIKMRSPHYAREEWYKYAYIRYVEDIDSFREECSRHHYYDRVEGGDAGVYWFYQHLINFNSVELYEYFIANDFKPENVVIQSEYDHTFRDIKGNVIPTLVHIDYICGFEQPPTNLDEDDFRINWDWNALVNHLQNHPDVVNFTESEIPYYNSDFSGQRCVEFDYLRSTNTESIDKIKNRLLCRVDGVDPLNVKQFIKNGN